MSSTYFLNFMKMKSVKFGLNFYRAAWNADEVLRWEFCQSVRPSVRPSVCLSAKRVHCDKIKEKSVQIFTSYERIFILVFWEIEWLVGATPSTWNFGPTGPRWSEITDFEPIIARRASAVTPSEKSSINTNRKSNTRFPMSLRWSSYVAPNCPKGSRRASRAAGARMRALEVTKCRPNFYSSSLSFHPRSEFARCRLAWVLTKISKSI